MRCIRSMGNASVLQDARPCGAMRLSVRRQHPPSHEIGTNERVSERGLAATPQQGPARGGTGAVAVWLGRERRTQRWANAPPDTRPQPDAREGHNDRDCQATTSPGEGQRLCLVVTSPPLGILGYLYSARRESRFRLFFVSSQKPDRTPHLELWRADLWG